MSRSVYKNKRIRLAVRVMLYLRQHGETPVLKIMEAVGERSPRNLHLLTYKIVSKTGVQRKIYFETNRFKAAAANQTLKIKEGAKHPFETALELIEKSARPVGFCEICDALGMQGAPVGYVMSDITRAGLVVIDQSSTSKSVYYSLPSEST